MAHNVEKMAYVGQTPWHGLGNKLTKGSTLDVWKKEAGLDWDVLSAGVTYTGNDDKTHDVGDRVVLYRSDNNDPLGIVGDRYKVVQPGEVIDFYDDLVETMGFHLHTAGSLKGGRIIWALAETGNQFTLPGKDKVEGYLMLSTSNDKSMATRAMFTSVRVVCNNTLSMALNRDGKKGISVTHASNFDAKDVKEQLSLYDAGWKSLHEYAKAMATRKMSDKEASLFFSEVFQIRGKTLEETAETKAIKRMEELFAGEAIGHDLASSNGTLWGAVNCITQYLDHERGNTPDTRLMNSWFKKGSRQKLEAYQKAIDLL